MSGEEGAFLSRWSRRKLETRRSLEPQESELPELQQEATPDSGAPEPAVEAELTPEEVAALPKIEELTPESDLTAFLRKGIPEALRNAALRRMWAVDPTVRDYVGDARDYAYDWNIPGGVPGNGPLSPTSDSLQTVKNLFSDHGRETQEVESAAAEGEGEETSAVAEAAPAPQLATESVRLEQPPAPKTEPTPQRADTELAADPEPRVPPRRHGGAIPA